MHLLDFPADILSLIDDHISDITSDKVPFRLYVYSEGWMAMQKKHLLDWYQEIHGLKAAFEPDTE